MSQDVSYRPAPVLHWFTIGGKTARAKAKKSGKEILQGTDLASGLRKAAGAAADFGKGALSDIAHRSADETSYSLFDDAFEVTTLTSRKRFAYSEVREIVAEGHDRYEIVGRSGRHTVVPVAHLVSGRVRVPVGWVRNGMEVPYTMLIDELSARAGVEIVKG